MVKKTGLVVKLIGSLLVLLVIWGVGLTVFFVGDTKKTFLLISEKVINKNEKEIKRITNLQLEGTKKVLFNATKRFAETQKEELEDIPFILYRGKERELKEEIMRGVTRHTQKAETVCAIIIETMTEQTEKGIENIIHNLKRYLIEENKNTAKRMQLQLFLFIFFGSIVFAVLKIWWINKIVINPMHRVLDGIKKVAKGDFSVKMKVETNDEIGELAKSFNTMTANLENTTVSMEFLIKETKERKKLEDERVELMKDLEYKNKELDDFTYIVSHDLKEPLRAINAFSKFIMDDYKDKLDEDGKGYLERIKANSEGMKRLIDDLLGLSRIGKNKNVYEEIDIQKVIDEVKNRFEYLIKEKNVQIIVQGTLPIIYCDRIRITEVFANLISNAVKYADKTPVIIEIGCAEKEKLHEFYVKDNGPGIEEKYFEKIFKIFQRLCKKEECEGTGAGLTIVQKIVSMHKGDVWIESIVGEGATFFFTIPHKDIILGVNKKIGEILIDKKIATKEEIETALKEQEEENQR